MWDKIKSVSQKVLVAVGLGGLVGAGQANAQSQVVSNTVTEVTNIATQADTLFTTVRGIAIGMVALGILIFVVRKIKGR